MEYIALKLIDKKSRQYNLKGEKEFYSDYKNKLDKIEKIYKFENLYDQLIESYLDFKNEVYSSGIRFYNKPNHHYVEIYKIKSKINNLAFNLLNLSKLYLDTVNFKDKSLVLDITESQEKHSILKDKIKEEYDSNAGYRLAYKLRNYIQHHSLPLNDFMIGESCNQEKQQKNVEFLFLINRHEIINKSISKKAVDDFTVGELINLDSLLFEYIKTICIYHKTVWELISEDYYKLNTEVESLLYSLKVVLEKEYKIEPNSTELYELIYEENKIYNLKNIDIVKYLQSNHKIITVNTYV